MIQTCKTFLRRFRDDSRGATLALEFMIIAPALALFIMLSFETGMIMLRQVLLDRGLDQAVREVRLSTATPMTYAQIKERVCIDAGFIDDCEADLSIQMVRFDPHEGFDAPNPSSCSDLIEPINPVENYETGTENELMFVRACVLLNTDFTWSLIGTRLLNSMDNHSLVATSMYVTEPTG